MDAFFVYKGKSSTDFGIKILNELEWQSPERDIDKIEVPGRDGAILIDNNRYKEIERKIEITLETIPETTLDTQVRKITEWLHSEYDNKNAYDYHDLYFSGMDGYIYKAVLNETISIKEKFRHFGQGEITFTLQPYMYRSDGEEEIQIYQNGGVQNFTINNTEAYASKPLIILQPQSGSISTNVTMNIAGSQIKLEGMEGFYITDPLTYYIDCEDETVSVMTSEGLVPWEHVLKTYPFPVIKPGENTINILLPKGFVNFIKIIPRWRTLAI